MNEKHRTFVLPKRAAIARTIYRLCTNDFEDCYAAKIHREQHASDTSYNAVHEAVQAFEEHGWIERTTDKRTKQIRLTEEGRMVFAKLVELLNLLDDDPWEAHENGPGLGPTV